MRNRSTLTSILGSTLLMAWAIGCGGGGEEASATIESRNMSTVTGTAVFKLDGGFVKGEITVENLMPPNAQHGVHIHDVGDCGMEAMAAGPHWNPGGATTPEAHGMPNTTASHLGDMGNMMVDASGKGTLTFSNQRWTLGDGSATDVVGHAVIIHENPDDYGPVMYGNAGKRLGCGIITKM